MEIEVNHSFFVFQIDSEVSIKGINWRFAAFITSLSILKETVDINFKITEKNVKMDSCVRRMNSKFELSTLIVFSFSDAFRDGYFRNKREIS